MPGAEDSYHLIRVQDAQANSKADTFFIAPKELGTENSPVHRIVLQTLAGEITGDVEISSLTGDGLSVDADGNLTADADAPDDAEYVLLSPDPDLAGAQVHSNLSGEELHDPADHSATHESGGSDTLDLGSLDVLSNLDLDGNAILDSQRGVVVIDANDLQLAEGQSIRDENSNSRLDIQAARTVLTNDAGRAGISASEVSGISARPDSGRPWFVRDVEGGFNGYIYRPSAASPGTLELANAVLTLPNGTATDPALSFLNDTNSGLYRPGSGGVFDLVGNANTVARVNGPGRELDLSQSGSDLVLDTGASVEDPFDVSRLSVDSDLTAIRDEAGSIRFSARDGSFTQVQPSSTSNWRVFDVEMGATAYRYETSASSPGTLVLSNAELDVLSDEGTVDTKITVSGDSTGETASKIRSGVNVSLQDDESTIVEVSVQFDTAGFVAVRNESGLGGLSAAFVNDDVNILASNGSVATSDTDGSICLFVDANDDLILKNRTGAEESFTVSGILTS